MMMIRPSQVFHTERPLLFTTRRRSERRAVPLRSALSASASNSVFSSTECEVGILKCTARISEKISCVAHGKIDPNNVKVNKLIFVQWLSMDRIERVQNTKKIQFTRCKLHNHSTIMLPLFRGGLFPWTTLRDFPHIPSSSLKSLSAVRFPGYSRPCCLLTVHYELFGQLVVEQVESLQQMHTTPTCNRFKGVIVLNTMRAYCTQ